MYMKPREALLILAGASDFTAIWLVAPRPCEVGGV